VTRKIFVNVAVQDLQKSQEFFTALGFRFDPRFTDTNAACMVINDDCAVMLLTRDFFRRFTRKELVDAAKNTESIISVSADRKEEVDELVNRAFEAGARPSIDPIENEGMYAWGFQDLDGHLWEVVWMDPRALEA
jgi:uncharacterized protein